MALSNTLVVFFGLQLLKVSANKIFQLDKCAYTNQTYIDDYHVLSTDARSSLECAIMVSGQHCENFFFKKSTKMCVCIITGNADTSPKRSVTLVNNMLSGITDTNDPTLHYVMKEQCVIGYYWLQEIRTCIRVYTEEMNFTSAMQLCSKDGARLFVSSNSTKTHALNRYLFCNGYTSRYWVGLYDKDVDGNYKWVDGSPLTYIFESASLKGSETDGLCLRVKYKDAKFNWIVMECHYRRGVICEIKF